MKFLADENVEKPIVEFLRQQGFDVRYIAEERRSLDDEAVLALLLTIKTLEKRHFGFIVCMLVYSSYDFAVMMRNGRHNAWLTSLLSIRSL